MQHNNSLIGCFPDLSVVSCYHHCLKQMLAPGRCNPVSFSLLLLAITVVAGCASVPQDYPRTPSTAFEDHQSTAIGQYLADIASRHPDESGFALIRYGRNAFTTRLALTDLAEHSLDLQYYIWEADITGRIFAERLVRAADRGVRVRVLLDDINLKGRDAAVAALDAHPNIEIRLFNPFAHRSMMGLDFLTDFNRVNHRMHNKIMVMDNAVAIVGGRNIGNHYFNVATDANFRDLDMAAAGPVVRDTSAVFDHFWNGEWAVPISALVSRPYTEDDLQAALKQARERIAQEDYPYPLDQDIAGLKASLTQIFDQFIWAPGVIVWDDPVDIVEEGRTTTILAGMRRRIDALEREWLIESAYLVIPERGIEVLKNLHERGVRIRILTNSLASNDVIAAHAGYSNTRREMVASGVELYELRPYPGPVSKELVSGSSKAALHTKAMVFDRRDVFIGSFNLDPRSSDINTEAGLYVQSPELAEQVIAYLNEGVRPQNSYRVQLDEEGKLYWITEDNGEPVRYDKDPESGFWQRFMAGFIRILPVESQL